MDLELAGRRVLVTGAATGIGRSTVQTLAAEGCRIAALDIDEGGLAQLVAAVGPRSALCRPTCRRRRAVRTAWPRPSKVSVAWTS